MGGCGRLDSRYLATRLFCGSVAAAERFMTITISNLTVGQNAPAGTTVGVLMATDRAGKVIPCNFILTQESDGYFAISIGNLVTAWNGSIAPGYYAVRVRAIGIYRRFSASATFVVTVAAVTPPPARPTGITLVPSTTSLPDNSVAGTTVAVLSVSMSDGSAFSGTLGASPADTIAISGNTRLVLARGLGPADVGPNQWMVDATQDGVTVSSPVQVQVVSNGRPYPTGIAFTPTAASLPDNAVARTTVAAVAVAMSDISAHDC